MLTVHVLANRIVPASPKPPISGLSPSELDMSYVAYGTSLPRGSGAASWLIYSVLCVCGAVHWIAGSQKISARLMPRQKKKPHAYARSLRMGLVVGGILLIGLWRIGEQRHSVPPLMRERVRAQGCATDARCARRTGRCSPTASCNG